MAVTNDGGTEEEEEEGVVADDEAEDNEKTAGREDGADDLASVILSRRASLAFVILWRSLTNIVKGPVGGVTRVAGVSAFTVAKTSRSASSLSLLRTFFFFAILNLSF